MAYIKINDKEITVENGKTILDAAKEVGIKIPHYCYHPKLSIAGSCRMCLVEVEGAPKLLTACSTRVGELPPERKIDGKFDMVVRTETNVVKDARESILEFLLLNHPIDCPECDQAGYCKLQDYSYEHGKDKSRFEFPKRVPPKKDLGPTMLLYTTRCILCSRCVRFTREISGTNELIVNRRGASAEIDTFPEMPLDNKLSMNVADLCPVGALVTKDFLFKPRVWNYNSNTTICTKCSKGCNIHVDYIDYENKIYRIKPVYNKDVNEYWMCDEGRLFYHEAADVKRLTKPMHKVNNIHVTSNWFKVTNEVFNKLSETDQKDILFIVSAALTNEELFMLKKLHDEVFPEATVVLADNYLKLDDEVFPGFTIEGTKVPNLKGFEIIWGKTDTLTNLIKSGKTDKFKVIYYINGDIHSQFDVEILNGLKNADSLIVQDFYENSLTEIADYILPSAGPYEKDGTYVNSNQIVQRARKILVPTGAAKTDFDILVDLFEKFDLPAPIRASKVFQQMAEQIALFKDLEFNQLKPAKEKKK
ncbi:MAG: 2Fe-2S iron-sulfur cluster-binding protein [Calditrichia bacterium]